MKYGSGDVRQAGRAQNPIHSALSLSRTFITLLHNYYMHPKTQFNIHQLFPRLIITWAATTSRPTVASTYNITTPPVSIGSTHCNQDDNSAVVELTLRCIHNCRWADDDEWSSHTFSWILTFLEKVEFSVVSGSNEETKFERLLPTFVCAQWLMDGWKLDLGRESNSEHHHRRNNKVD